MKARTSNPKERTSCKRVTTCRNAPATLDFLHDSFFDCDWANSSNSLSSRKNQRHSIISNNSYFLPAGKEKPCKELAATELVRPRSLLFLQLTETATEIATTWRKQKWPLYLFLAIAANLLLAPAVYATSTHALTRGQAWALGILGLGTVALSIYIFVVIFQPEKF